MSCGRGETSEGKLAVSAEALVEESFPPLTRWRYLGMLSLRRFQDFFKTA